MPENTTSNAPAAFLSYVHTDDEKEDGRITDLRRHLSNEVGMLTGTDFLIYQDRVDINLGQGLEDRIDDLIDDTTVLVAIITPAFLKSEMCRSEVRKFLAREQRLERGDLIISILYLPTPALHDASDDLARILSKRLYYTWGGLRFEYPDSNDYRRAINELAGQIVAAIERAEEPEQEPFVAEEEGSDNENIPDIYPDSDGRPGLIELLAETENAMPLFEQTIFELTGTLEELTIVAETSKLEIDAANRANKPAAAHLAAARRFAKRLDDPATEMERIADDYTDHLLRVDRGMDALIGQVSISRSEEDLEVARELLVTLNNLVVVGDEGLEALAGLQQTFEPLYGLSSTLRPPLNRMAKAIRKITPSRDTFRNWRDNLALALEVPHDLDLLKSDDAP